MRDAARYEAKALAEIEECKQLGYNPTRWRVMVAEHGAVEATKRLLHQTGTFYEDGGERLARMGRLDLTVEWLVLDPEWHDLFSDEDRRLAYAAIELGMRESGSGGTG